MPVLFFQGIPMESRKPRGEFGSETRKIKEVFSYGELSSGDDHFYSKKI